MKARTQLFHLAASAVLLFASAPAAKAQAITAAPSSLAFAYQIASSNPSAQTVNVSGTAGLGVTVTKQAPTIGASEWLFFSSSSSLPFTMTVFVLANSSFPAGTYSATITVTPAGGGTALVIPVSFMVSANPLLTSAPASLTFQYALNGGQPPQQTVSIGSSGTTQLNFSSIATTTSGGGWLNIAPPATGTTPTVLTIGATVNNTFAVGTYTGKVSLTSTGQGNPTLDIPVTLVVTPETTLTVAPSTVAFTFQTGTSAPLPRVLTVSSTGASVGVGVTTEATGGGAGPTWLSVTPTSGPTPLNLSIQVNPTGLALGEFTANIKLTGPGASNSPVTVPVTLKITDKPVVQLSASSLTFHHQSGGSAPASELVLVTNPGAGLPIGLTVTTASGGTWLSATPTSTTSPAALLVAVDPGTLVPGDYTGSVGIAVPGAAVAQMTLPVTLRVSANPLMRMSRNRLGFVHQTGQTAPTAKTVSLSSTGAAIAYTVSSNVATGGSWLTVSAASGTTPADLLIGVNPAGLVPGIYSGTVTVTPTGVGGVAQTIEVTLQVSDAALLNVPDLPLRFAFGTGGQQPPDQVLNVTATSGAVSYTVSPATMSGGAWLIAGPLSGTAGQPVTVGVDTRFSGGTYTGLLTIASSASNSPIYVPVLYNGNNSSALQVTPNSLKFTQTSGVNPPAAQTLAVSSTGSRLDFTTTVETLNGGDWLAATPSGGLTPGTLTVSIKVNALTAGTYTGTIKVTSSALGVQQVVPITLEVPPAVNQLVAAPASLAFTHTIGGAAPPAQTLNLKSSSSVNFTLSTTTASGVQWLAVSPGNGTTEANITVSVNVTGLAAGVHTGSINMTAPVANNSPLVIPVTLTVTAPPAGTLTAFQHGASFTPAEAAPGLIVTLRGTGIGPATGVSFQLTPQGTVPTTVSETRVLFDGLAAPILYTSATQINCIVPYELAGAFSTRVEVEYKGVKSNVLERRVAATAPGIFSLTSTGSGQGAILNQNGTVNSTSNPAPRGEVIVIYATGEGQTTPVGVNGSVPRTVAELKKPLGAVKVRIGGVEVTPLYAGSAPSFVSGVLQVNAMVPEGIAAGANVPVELIVGTGTSAAQSITVAVR